MERLSERLTALEAIIRKLEPVESFLERVELLEKNIYATKKVFTFSEACMYIGVSESMLYKLTANKEIPHYKPRGKMIYFAKEELDEWLLQNHELAVDDATRMAHEAAAVQPFLNEKRHGKRKEELTRRREWDWKRPVCQIFFQLPKSRRRIHTRPRRKLSGLTIRP